MVDDKRHSEPPPDAPEPTKEGAPDAVKPRRRGALKALVVAGSAAYGAALLVPAVRFATPDPAKPRGSARWFRVAKLSALGEGKPERVRVTGDDRDAFTVTRDQVLGSVWLLRQGDGVDALSAECPHLGCAVGFGDDAKSFSCPCHTSRFALDGTAEAGPSPRGMDKLDSRVVDGFVEVLFKRFRQGVTGQQEVG